MIILFCITCLDDGIEGGEDSVAPSVSIFGETSREKAEREKQREMERQRLLDMRHNQMSMNAVLQRLHVMVVTFFQQFYRTTLSGEDLRQLAEEFPVGYDPVKDLRLLPERMRGRFFTQVDAPPETVCVSAVLLVGADIHTYIFVFDFVILQ